MGRGLQSEQPHQTGGIEEFGADLVANENVFFIFEDGLYHKELPVIMYFRHTYGVDCEVTDSFQAGERTYEVYRLIER